MLLHRCFLPFFVASLLCLASAFSTRFIIDKVDEGKKTEKVEEIKPKTVEVKETSGNLLNPQNIEVEVIPIMTEAFTQTDLHHLTPLKVVTAVAAQHLLTTVQNIPVSGNSYQETLSMLEGVVKEFNKTAQIIKLTAEYVNISGHYILSNLVHSTKTECEQKFLDDGMISIRKQFVKAISDHINNAVKELNQKTIERDMTGSDILIASAYHIVTAFQEMTNQSLALAEECKFKCNGSLIKIEVTSSNEQTNDSNLKYTEMKPSGHKSIKKDQANPQIENKAKHTGSREFQDQLITIENLGGNQDLTVEVFSPEAVLGIDKKEPMQKNTLKVPSELKVEYIPLKTIQVLQNPINEVLKQTKENTPTQKENIDKELATSAVNSLSDIRQVSSELDINKKFTKAGNEKYANSLPQQNDLLDILHLLAPGHLDSLDSQPKQLCDESVEPVCGIDLENKKFIIFLNDCKRKTHNQKYKTNYSWFSMETCVGLLFRKPASQEAQNVLVNKYNNVDLRPR